MNPQDNKPWIYLREVERRMQKNWVRKGLVFGIICLFLGTSVVPNISGNIKELNEEKKVSNINNGKNSGIIFFDDFNSWDPSKWKTYNNPTVSVSNGELTLTETTGQGGFLVSKVNIPMETKTEIRFKQVQYGVYIDSQYAALNQDLGTGVTEANQIQAWDSDYQDYWRFWTQRDGSGSGWDPLGGCPDIFNYHIIKYVWQNDIAEYYYDDVLIHTRTENVPYIDLNVVFRVQQYNSIVIDWVKVTELGGGNQNPVADFTWTPQPPNPGQTVNFDASLSQDIDGTITSYQWDFDNDGQFDDRTGEYTTWTWPNAGDYPVSLKVTDNLGATGTKTQTVTVDDENCPFYFIHITDPHITDTWFGDDENWKGIIKQMREMNPPPAFVLLTGDLVDWGDGGGGYDNYGEFTAHLWKSGDVFYIDPNYQIPIYFCPGNHDAMWGNNFNNYYNKIKGTDYYMISYKNCRIFSMNSGVNDWQEKPIYDSFDELGRPEGDGLKNQYSNECNQLLSDLDGLDGIANGRDDSPYVKIIMTHHPYDGARKSQLDMVFWYWRPDFITAFNTYNVNYLLSGHIHDLGHVGPLGTQNGKQVITNGIAYDNSYRKIYINSVPYGKIYINSSGGTCTPNNMERFSSTVGGQIHCQSKVDIYDEQGNHDGLNETGGIETEINLSGYYYWKNETLNVTYVDFRLPKNDSKNYTIIIEGLSNESMNFTLYTSLIGGYRSKATYSNVSMYNGSIATIHANESIYNYTMVIKDPDQSIRYVSPSNYEDNQPPEPGIPSGKEFGFPGHEYTYTVNATDPNGDNVYYLFDWGDGTNSSWLSPYESGEMAKANHTWTMKGTYVIKAKAKDDYGLEGNWSEPLTIRVFSLQPTLVFGLITEKNQTGEFITCKARFLAIYPSNSLFYSSGETIVISKDYTLGFVGNRFAIGIFDTAIISETSSSRNNPLRDRLLNRLYQN